MARHEDAPLPLLGPGLALIAGFIAHAIKIEAKRRYGQAAQEWIFALMGVVGMIMLLSADIRKAEPVAFIGLVVVGVGIQAFQEARRLDPGDPNDPAR